MTWQDALACCDWLTQKLHDWKGAFEDARTWLDNTIHQGWRVTLPSEAEREKAARGPDGRIYPWGDDFDRERANLTEAGVRHSAVGAFPLGASPYVLDASGNVWEWTRSMTRSFPYAPTTVGRT